jgi:hypothetical protein
MRMKVSSLLYLYREQCGRTGPSCTSASPWPNTAFVPVKRVRFLGDQQIRLLSLSACSATVTTLPEDFRSFVDNADASALASVDLFACDCASGYR